MDDRNIVDLFWSRDESAIGEAERKYKGYCASIARGILGDARDSEECVNDALLTAWRTIPPGKPENLRTYLAKLVRNISINRYVKDRAEKRGSGSVEVALEELEGCLAAYDTTDSVVDSIALGEMIDRFLGTLKKEARIMFVQKYWYFRTVGEIARDLAVTESKVKSTLMRTRESLQRYLEKEGHKYEK